MSRRAAAPTMPHISLALLLRWLPGRDRHLLRAREGELPGRRVLVDRRARADVRAPRDAHGRDQGRIRADEALVLDHRAVLGDAVVVAGDGSGADIHARADLRIADIGEVVRLRARADAARLHPHAIAGV